MQLCILLESRLLSTMPKTIETIFDAGQIQSVFGNHVILQGPENDFKSWLKGQKVLVGQGPMMMQSFDLVEF